MSAIADPEETAGPKKSKLPLILGLVCAVAGGGGGFYAVSAGLIPRGGDSTGDASADPHGATDDHAVADGGGHDDTQDVGHGETASISGIAFVPLDPIVVSLPHSTHGSLLRFSAQLEVTPEYEGEVAGLKPRIVDVLNGYLRAVKPDDLADPMALARLRSQMLRRVQIVVGSGRVNDVLIMEFVVN